MGQIFRGVSPDEPHQTCCYLACSYSYQRAREELRKTQVMEATLLGGKISSQITFSIYHLTTTALEKIAALKPLSKLKNGGKSPYR